nr:unnamed protein product [Digitaria exilis]
MDPPRQQSGKKAGTGSGRWDVTFCRRDRSSRQPFALPVVGRRRGSRIRGAAGDRILAGQWPLSPRSARSAWLAVRGWQRTNALLG